MEPGQILVANTYQSVDPDHREFMDEGGWEKGFGLEGRTVGTVVETRDPDFPEGAIVFHRNGYATQSLLTREDRPRLITPPDGVPLSAYLSILGSAGSANKVEYLTKTLGFDAAFDYHDGAPAELLAAAAPEGVDVFFDNVGGDHLEAGIAALRHGGRIAWCGAISQYNDSANPPSAPLNLYDVVGKALRLEGFLVRDHMDAREEFEAFLTPRIASGEIVPQETIVEGFEHTVDAFIGMLRGENVGKMLVRL